MRHLLFVAAFLLIISCARTPECDPAKISGRFVGGTTTSPIVVDLLHDGTGAIDQGTPMRVTWEFDRVSGQVFITGSNAALSPLLKASQTPSAPTKSPPTTEGIHGMSLRCAADGQAISLVADDDGLVRFERK
jgi:hypothetical protein